MKTKWFILLFLCVLSAYAGPGGILPGGTPQWPTYHLVPGNNTTFATNGNKLTISSSGGGGGGSMSGLTNYTLQAAATNNLITNGIWYGVVTNLAFGNDIAGTIEITSGTQVIKADYWFVTGAGFGFYQRTLNATTPVNNLRLTTDGAGKERLDVKITGGPPADLSIIITGSKAGKLLFTTNTASLGFDVLLNPDPTFGVNTGGGGLFGGTLQAGSTIFNAGFSADVFIYAYGNTANINLIADNNINVTSTNGAFVVNAPGGIIGNGTGLTNVVSANSLTDTGGTVVLSTGGGSSINVAGGWHLAGSGSGLTDIASAIQMSAQTSGGGAVVGDGAGGLNFLDQISNNRANIASSGVWSGNFSGATNIPITAIVGQQIATLFTNATLDFGSTAAGQSSALTTPLLGIGTNSDWEITCTPNKAVMDSATNGVFFAWISATNTVSVRFDNPNLVSAIDPASGKFRIVARQYSP